MRHPEHVISIPKAHNGPVHASVFSRLGPFVFTGGQDRNIKLWNIKTQQLVHSIKGHAYEVLDLAIAHDETHLVSCGGGRNVYVWDLSVSGSGNDNEDKSTGGRAPPAMVHCFQDHIARVNSVCFNESSNVVASGSYDATVKLWDCRGQNSHRKPIQTLVNARDSITSVKIAGHFVYTGSVDGCVRIYDLRMGQLNTLTMGRPGPQSVTSVTPSVYFPNHLLVSTLDGTIRIMDRISGAMIKCFKGHVNSQFRFPSVFANFHENNVATISEDGSLVVWDAESTEQIAHLKVDRDEDNSPMKLLSGSDMGYSLAVSASGDKLVSSRLSGGLDIWEVY